MIIVSLMAYNIISRQMIIAFNAYLLQIRERNRSKGDNEERERRRRRRTRVDEERRKSIRKKTRRGDKKVDEDGGKELVYQFSNMFCDQEILKPQDHNVSFSFLNGDNYG